jgi:hypothetical protein
MKRFLVALAVGLLLLAGQGARAENLTSNVAWTYSFTPGAPAVTADGNNAAGVTFTAEPPKTAVGNSDIVATNLRVFSTAKGSAPDQLVSNGDYSLALQLSATDAMGVVHNTTLKFTGKLGGSFSSESANVTNMFGADSTQTTTLGDWKFSVTLNSYAQPGPPDEANAGSISGHVTITPNGNPAPNPEPSTLLLSGLGLTFLGAATWRKRRARAQAEVA